MIHGVRLPHRGGFTLVEIAAVTLILALVAGVVAWSFARPIATVRAGDAVQQLRNFDAVARHAARASARESTLVYQPDDNALERHEPAAGGETIVTQRTLLPAGVRVADVRLLRPPDRFRGRRTAIRCSVDGSTQTYAVRLVGSGLDRWVLFAGLTGQPTEVEHESEVDAIFRSALATAP